MTDKHDQILIGKKQAIGTRELLEDQIDAKTITTKGGMTLTVGIVADGIGGEGHGERAARLTVDTVLSEIKSSEGNNIPKILEQALTRANRVVNNEMKEYRHQQDMGCTATVVVVHEMRLYLANVGDSRAYLVRDQKITQLTIDHSWGNEMLRSGRRKEEDLHNNPNKDKITRSIGYDKSLKVDLGVYKTQKQSEDAARKNQGLNLKPGDRIVICSDGLIKERRFGPGHFTESIEIVNHVNANEPQKAAERLTALAESRQIKRDGDNISVIIFRVPGGSKVSEIAAKGRQLVSRKLVLPGIVAMVILFCIIGLIASRMIFSDEDSEVEIVPTIPSIAENVAYISEGRGRIENRRPGEAGFRVISVGEVIESGQGSIIRVVGEGRLRLGLPDGSLVFLSSDTEIELRQIAGQEANVTETHLVIHQGLLLVSANLEPGINFAVSTEDGARATVTGSLMGVQHKSKTGNSPARFELDCLEGQCVLKDRNGVQQELSRRQFSWLVGGGAPENVGRARCELYETLGDPDMVPCPPTPTPTFTPSATLTSTPTLTPTPTATFIPPFTSTPAPKPPTPQPTTPPSCTLNLSGDNAIRKGQTGNYTANVTLKGGASVAEVKFSVAPGGILSLSTIQDNQAPYKTKADALKVGSATITAKAILNEGGSCKKTINVTVTKNNSPKNVHQLQETPKLLVSVPIIAIMVRWRTIRTTNTRKQKMNRNHPRSYQSHQY